MANSLIHLNSKLQKRIKQINEKVDGKVSKIALTVLSSLVIETPVDTGAAKSNWLVGLSAPVEHTIEPHSPGMKGDTADQNIGTAIRAGSSVISGKKPKQSIYISNNLDYIHDLNYKGTSPQNELFVEAAIMKGKSIK